jgi:hypothetical protein
MTLICDIDLICKHKWPYIVFAIVILIFASISGFIFMRYSQRITNHNVLKLHEEVTTYGKGSFVVSENHHHK